MNEFSEEEFAHAIFVWVLIFILALAGVFAVGFLVGRKTAPECAPLPACRFGGPAEPQPRLEVTRT